MRDSFELVTTVVYCGGCNVLESVSVLKRRWLSFLCHRLANLFLHRGIYYSFLLQGRNKMGIMRFYTNTFHVKIYGGSHRMWVDYFCKIRAQFCYLALLQNEISSLKVYVLFPVCGWKEMALGNRENHQLSAATGRVKLGGE